MRRNLGLKNAVYELLKRMETEAPTGLVRIRSGGGDVAGSIMASGGRLCFASAARRGRRPSEKTALNSKLHRALDDALARGVKLSEAILAQDTSDVTAVRRALRTETSRAVVDIIRACRGAEGSCEVKETRDDYDPRLTFTPLDVFLGASEVLDQLPSDSAKRFYEEFSPGVDAALLFMRPGESRIPLPVAGRGLEERRLGDLGTMSRAVGELSSPRALEAQGVEPTVCVRVLRDGVWISLVGPLRIAVVRTPRTKEILGRMVRRAFDLARVKDLIESA